jgi:hypothetical protein
MASLIWTATLDMVLFLFAYWEIRNDHWDIFN